MTRKCPECESESQTKSPFCENCGFRFGGRVAPTVQESVVNVNDTRPAVNATAGVPPESLRTTKEQAVQPREKIKTKPEGLNSVDTATEGLDAVDTAAEEVILSDRDDGLDSDNRLAIIGAAIAVLIGIALLIFTIVNSRTSAPVNLGEAIKVGVAAGDYTHGLSDEARSLFLTLCERQKIDDDTVCGETELFNGEFPVEKRTVSSFEIDGYEITGSQYDACTIAGSCTAPDVDNCRVYTHAGLQMIRTPSVLTEPDKPVVCVTWQQANDYCAYDDGKLPTGDQWEKAARGSTDGRTFPWGDHWDPAAANWAERDALQTPVLGQLDDAAWTAIPGSHNVDRSPSGVFDMAGNVLEWTREKTAAGGSWTSAPADLRVTKRQAIDATKGRTDLGFRCVYEP